MTASRVRAVGPALATGALALAIGTFLAVQLGPRLDELHTVAHLNHASLGELWRSYRDAHDTLPPAGYGLAWLWAQVAGQSLLAVRMLSVLAWSVAATGLALLVRRSTWLGMVVAGLVPCATALLYLCTFARPYAVGLAAAVWGTVCWQRAPEVTRRRWWWVGSAAFFALSCSQHYLLAVVPAALAVSWWFGRRGEAVAPLGRAPAVALVAGVSPLITALVLAPQAIDDQGRLPWTVHWTDGLTFWPSSLRSVALLLLVGVVITAAVAGKGERPQGLVGRAAGPLALLGPVAAVLAMMATSGVYLHRYSIGALVGGAVWAGWRSSPVARNRLASIALVVVLLAAVGLQVRWVTTGFISAAEAERLPTELGLEDPASGEVLVSQEYEFQMLRMYASDELRDRLHLATTNAIVDSPAPETVSDLLADHEVVTVVGDPGEVEVLLADAGPVDETVAAEATYPRPLVDRDVQAVRVQR